MTLYAIFDPKPGQPALPAAIPEEFSWFAASMPPVFFWFSGLWLELLLWVAKVVALVLLSRVIGDDAAVLLYLTTAIWLGFAAPGLRRHALLQRGWTHRGDRVALNAELAQLEALA